MHIFKLVYSLYQVQARGFKYKHIFLYMIYLLTIIQLKAGGSSTLHIYT